MPLRTLTSARAGCLGSLPRDVSAGARGGGCLPWRLMRCWGAGARLRFPGASRRCAGRTATASPPGSGLRRPSPVVNIRNALGQVSVVQGPGLPFEGPLGSGADARRRAADLPGDAGQGAVRRGGEPGGRGGAGEGEHAVRRGPPGAGARAHQVAEDLVAACGSSRIRAAAACRVMPGGRLGAVKSQLPPVCIFAASFMLRTISKGAER